MLLEAILNTKAPILFIENKLLYLLPVQDAASLSEFDLQASPLSPNLITPNSLTPNSYTLTLHAAPPPTITLATYGYMAELSRQAALKLAYEHEVFIEILILTQLSPFEVEPVLASASRTRRLLTVEEGTYSLGWGAEILARAVEALGPILQSARRLAARDLPIPSSGPLEAAVLPSVEQIVEYCLKIT